MRKRTHNHGSALWAMLITVFVILGGAHAQEPVGKGSSYAPVAIKEDFAAIMTRMKAAKAEVMKRHMDLLNVRYDLGDHPAPAVTMARSKPVQEGVRVRLAPGVTWEKLAGMDSNDIREQDLFPAGFLPLPHPNHPEGGMLFPKFHIEEVRGQEARDLTRFDLDYDLPDHLLPEFPPEAAGDTLHATVETGDAPAGPRVRDTVVLTDIKTLRKRARQHIENGAVTPGYQADRETVIRILNEALATEIVCVLRYRRHHFMATGINAQSVAEEFLQHANEEQMHADQIAQRIVQLGGAPNFSPEGLLARSHAEYVEGDSLIDMIKEDLIAERIACACASGGRIRVQDRSRV